MDPSFDISFDAVEYSEEGKKAGSNLFEELQQAEGIERTENDGQEHENARNEYRQEDCQEHYGDKGHCDESCRENERECYDYTLQTPDAGITRFIQHLESLPGQTRVEHGVQGLVSKMGQVETALERHTAYLKGVCGRVWDVRVGVLLVELQASVPRVGGEVAGALGVCAGGARV